MILRKSCTLCGKRKLLSSFPNQRSQPDGHACWCKKCHCDKIREWRIGNPEKTKAATLKWRRNNPGWHRSSALRKRYGIENHQYDALLQAQNKRCAICRRIDSDRSNKFLGIDHVAGTMKIRGLLCSRCNTGIGLLGHNPRFMRIAAEYLERRPVLCGVKFPRGIHRTGRFSNAGVNP